VAGIGININQTRFEDALTNPVSLRQITGKSFDPKTIAQELTEQLNHRLAQWGDQGFSPVFEAYRSVLFGKSDTFQIREQGEEKTIRVMDVTPEGLLRVEENGSERCLSSGIEWIILP
jgi:BirA family biotin operon repressor/biotin-[acetyl-CoA-carboxylase] ligase